MNISPVAESETKGRRPESVWYISAPTNRDRTGRRLSAARLLGGDVIDRPHDHAGSSQIIGAVKRLDQAEVGHQARWLRRSSKILPGLMSRWIRSCRCAAASPARHCSKIGNASSNGKSAVPVQQVGQRLAVDELHGEEVSAGVLAKGKYLDDIRMHQLGDRHGFGPKTADEIGDGGQAPAAAP